MRESGRKRREFLSLLLIQVNVLVASEDFSQHYFVAVTLPHLNGLIHYVLVTFSKELLQVR